MKVSEFVSYHMRKCGKMQVEIAREVGFPRSNFLSMIRTGAARIPLNRVPALAESIGIPPRDLFLRCLTEYEPELLTTIQTALPGALLDNDDLQALELFKSRISALRYAKRLIPRSDPRA
jgi:hypothetical protein